MLRLCVVSAVLGTLALTACRESLETEPDADTSSGRVCKPGTSAECMMAATQSSLAWIEANVFAKSCAFSGCHNATNTAVGRIDLKNPGMSHADLVDIDSALETGKKLVVAGQPKQSYLLMMIQQFPPTDMEPTPASPPPDDIGFMPQNAPAICCQKIDAIERWIMEGAQNN
jgi:hypothetical protein